jgi:hypothetical protein
MDATASINNGLIFLGVHDEGHLNVPGIGGLRYFRDGDEYDATYPGCPCEGWGASASYSGGSLSGYANENYGIVNMVPEPIISDGTTATAVATLRNRLKVTHAYYPSPDTPNLYEVEVTYENVGSRPLTDLRYRRVMDWDIPPTEFSECVSIDTGSSKHLEYASDNGFLSGNPLEFAGEILFSCPDGVGCPVLDSGPADHGAVFSYLFKDEDDDTVNLTLAPGETFTFKIFYGAAANKSEADAAIDAVGADAYSYAYPSTNGCRARADGSPNVFIFAFAESTPCKEIVLDFEEYEAGEYVLDLGYGIKVRGDGNRARSGVMVFDSANPTGGDEDLASEDLGKILILSEDKDTTDPDDNALGGYIRFTFDPPISKVISIDLKDFDSRGSSITGKYAGGSDFPEIAIPKRADGSEQTVMIEESNVSRLKINLAESGGIDNLRLKYCEPE